MKTYASLGCTLTVLLLALVSPANSKAEFVPIPLTPDSFNQDVVVEQSAPPPVVPVTTASMDTGTENTGYAWSERGYNLDFVTVGLPIANSTVTLGVNRVHDCQFAPTYKTNNVLLIDSVLTHGTLTLDPPTACMELCFLVSSGNGSGSIGYKVHHLDGSADAGTLACHDWLDALNAAYTTAIRMNVNNFSYADLNMNRPGLYLADIGLTHPASPVTSVDFAYLGGSSHNVVFAVSGATSPGGWFRPLQISGYNVDMVIEASATHKGFLRGVTTATPEYGASNWANTWYERGYYSPAPATGLPAAGSVITNTAAPDHRYLLPPDYSANNAVVFDAEYTSAQLTPVAPLKYTALSFLGAAGNGPVTIGCQVHHADGSTETNWFVLPDWLNSAPCALNVTGRVNIDFRTVDLAKTPSLFARDIALTNTNSLVTNVALSYAGGSATSHAVLFALSGSTGVPAVERPVLSIVSAPGGVLRIRSSRAGNLQSAGSWTGSATVWRDEGPVTSEMVIQPPPGETSRFYRVLAR